MLTRTAVSAVLTIALLLQSSRSFINNKRPHLRSPGPGQPPVLTAPCNTSLASPIADAALATVSLGAGGTAIGFGIVTLTSIQASDSYAGLFFGLASLALIGVGALGLGVGGMFVGSSVFGFKSANACELIQGQAQPLTLKYFDGSEVWAWRCPS